MTPVHPRLAVPPRIALALLAAIVALVACRCDFNVARFCGIPIPLEGQYFQDENGLPLVPSAGDGYATADCLQYLSDACPPIAPEARQDPAAEIAYIECLDDARTAWNWGYPPPTPNYPYDPAKYTPPETNPLTEAGDGANPAQNIVAPPAAPAYDCSAFRLTSPLDGLPNGFTWFTWEGMGGSSIMLVFMDEAGAVLSSANAGNGAGGAAGYDVSQGNIGGGFQIRVRLEARTYEGSLLCSDEHLLMRAAPDNSQPAQSSQPTLPPPPMPITPTPIPPPA